MWRALAVLCLTGCTSVLRTVADLEDRRAASEVEPYARAGEPEVRRRALLALGRIQDPRSAPLIAQALGDPDRAVREEAAFAAGLMGMSWQPLDDATKALLADALLRAEETPAVLQALGRVATEPAITRLLERAEAGQPAALLSLGVAVKRGAKVGDRAVASLAASVGNAQQRDVRYGAAYLLAMTKNREARGALLSLLGDADPEVRALAAKGLADAGLAEDASVLHGRAADPDVRVAVEAVRALVKLKLELPPLDARAPLQLAAAQAGVVVESDDPKLKCRAAMASDRKKGVLDASARCGPLALHELANAPPTDTAALEPYLDGTSAEKLGALDALGAAKATALVPKIRPLLQSTDLIVAAGAAGALAKLQDRDSIPGIVDLAWKVPAHEDIAPGVADALTELGAKEATLVLNAWLKSTNATVRHTAAAALTKITGSKVVAPEVPLPQASPMPRTGAGLKLVTERGEIELELWNDEAPRTAGNLWTLANKGYFDGLTFHRIVPDFVAQGGDPRGDGEGGPGYSIRCEIGHRPYVRGTVGMALSGKDTGGSQFFITHTATPHLDGKYTAFGQVVRGMEVVDSLLEGDQILRVIALP